MSRLRSDIWVKALIRRCEANLVPAMVVQRGFETSGSVIVKVNRLDGSAQIYTPITGPEGNRLWICPIKSQAEDPSDADADAYISRQTARDSDLWVVEIEDPQGRHFIDEPVEGPAIST